MPTLNSAGGSAADPILNGIRMAMIALSASMDVAQINEAYIDQASGFPGTNTIRSSLTPAHTVVEAGTTASYNDTTKVYTIGDTTGLAADDYIYLSHADLTDGIYPIATVPSGTTITLANNPLDGSGNKTSIIYQVAWTYFQTAGTTPMVSSSGGTQNWFKFDAEDGSANDTQQESDFYVRDAPSGASYIAIEGASYTGQTVADNILTLAILSGWANQGGISHVELANHSVQSVNNFTWTTLGGTGEQTLAAAETNGLTASAGDGAKYGRLLLKSESGGTALGVDFDLTVDSAGPTISLVLVGA